MFQRIPKNELQEGWYVCTGRCPIVCYWDGEKFHTLRPKFGAMQHNEELHWDDDPKYGTVQPFARVSDVLTEAGYFDYI